MDGQAELLTRVAGYITHREVVYLQAGTYNNYSLLWSDKYAITRPNCNLAQHYRVVLHLVTKIILKTAYISFFFKFVLK